MKIIEYLQENWVEIGSAVALVAGAARIIVKLTPTPKDDRIYAKVIGFLKLLGLHIDPKGK